jgi:flagellar biosynthesis/type III secretory pathway M-ring protein FliF/YscJ
VKEIVATAVGLNPERGDRIAVQSMPVLVSTDAAGSNAPREEKSEKTVSSTSSAPADVMPPATEAALQGTERHMLLNLEFANRPSLWLVAVTMAVLACGLVAVIVWAFKRRRPAPAGMAQLSEHQRRQVLTQVEAWLAQASASAPTKPRTQ